MRGRRINFHLCDLNLFYIYMYLKCRPKSLSALSSPKYKFCSFFVVVCTCILWMSILFHTRLVSLEKEVFFSDLGKIVDIDLQVHGMTSSIDVLE